MQNYIFALLALLLAVPETGNARQCRLALVLALDVSGSVNEEEYAQQLNGLAFALNSDEVRDAILGSGAYVTVSVFEWSSRNHQFLVQPWVKLDSHAAIDDAILRIRSYRKKRAGLKTAMSTALLYGAELLKTQKNCWQHTIDVSGDGESNIGPSLRSVYRAEGFENITVNVLVVGEPGLPRKALSNASKKSELKRYFEQNVIRGPGAFAMIAHGYADYARAMQRKLVREISAPTIGLLP